MRNAVLSLVFLLLAFVAMVTNDISPASKKDLFVCFFVLMAMIQIKGED